MARREVGRVRREMRRVGWMRIVWWSGGLVWRKCERWLELGYASLCVWSTVGPLSRQSDFIFRRINVHNNVFLWKLFALYLPFHYTEPSNTTQGRSTTLLARIKHKSLQLHFLGVPTT